VTGTTTSVRLRRPEICSARAPRVAGRVALFDRDLKRVVQAVSPHQPKAVVLSAFAAGHVMRSSVARVKRPP